MKNLIIILLCFIVSILIYIIDFSFTLEKKLQFKGCSVTYSKIYLTSRDRNICENYYEEYRARIELVKCLCDEYIETKDRSVEKYIMDFYANDPDLHRIYKSEIIFKNDTGFILRNLAEIFEYNKSELKVVMKYKEGEPDKFNDVLMYYIKNSAGIQSGLQRVVDKEPYEFPTIDTLIKYKNIILKRPIRYCG